MGTVVPSLAERSDKPRPGPRPGSLACRSRVRAREGETVRGLRQGSRRVRRLVQGWAKRVCPFAAHRKRTPPSIRRRAYTGAAVVPRALGEEWGPVHGAAIAAAAAGGMDAACTSALDLARSMGMIYADHVNHTLRTLQVKQFEMGGPATPSVCEIG